MTVPKCRQTLPLEIFNLERPVINVFAYKGLEISKPYPYLAIEKETFQPYLLSSCLDRLHTAIDNWKHKHTS